MPRHRRTPRTTADTRHRLLQVAGGLLWERSFHAAGVEEICKRAGARKGSFYHFFRSKEQLAVEAIETSWDDVRTGVFDPIFQEPGLRGLERLERLVSAVDHQQQREYQHRGAYLGCPFGSLGQEVAHQEEHIREPIERIFEEHVDYFERALAQGVAEGEVEPGDLRQRARSLFALMEGGLLVAKVANSPGMFRATVRSLPLLASRHA